MTATAVATVTTPVTNTAATTVAVSMYALQGTVCY